MTTDHRPGFLVRHRWLFLLLGILIFLPPLALVFQATSGDNSFCGRWCPRMFFVWREGMDTAQYFFAWLRSLAGVILLFTILTTTLFVGRLWCSHLCPIGATMEFGSQMVPDSLKIPYQSIPSAPVRYGYMAAYLLLPLLGLGSLCCSYCHFAAVPRAFGASFGSPADIAYFLRTAGLINLGLIFLLGFMARGGRAYCNFLCPVGAFDALVNRFGDSRFGRRFRIIEKRCNGCGECLTSCPTWAIRLEKENIQIDQLACLPCGKCQQACPEGAICYTRPTAVKS